MMITQHPTLARVAALQARFWAHSPQTAAAPVALDPELDTTPMSLANHEAYYAERDDLEREAAIDALDADDRAYLAELRIEATAFQDEIDECEAALDDAALRPHEIDALWARRSNADVELENVLKIIGSFDPDQQ